ncbi:sugar phosphate nucleotidyltransferase [Metabacillus iocasae]|uniref:Mannose-1-phosphate guanylyltransferase/phosphomannomutase n=1 Tax=Priestia iocasae TaxID=2291674 RepID=A0ABS2QQC8_9BACI|nr:sugar phosphate nucleotidyltransferase [Metabacillus iocasae]MBM7701528.1 mannose-1-phosphate guanylyltransferase/phosphomannomutase [Metabacillus iocasae]
MKGIILAGGQGTRLKPLTDEVPKPMLPLCGKPVMEYSIELLKKHGITDIAVTLHHLHHHITSYFGDGSKWGVRLHYFIEKEPLGTAGSLKNTCEFIDDHCVVISGDALTAIDLQSVFTYHHRQQSVMTIITKEVESPLDYGMVLRNASGFVEKFIEKPRRNEVTSNLINTGVYIVTKKVLHYIEENKPFDFSLDLIPELLKSNEKVCSYLTEDYWIDIGQIHHYRQANYDLLNQKPTLTFPLSTCIEEDVIIAEQVTIHPPVYIGKGVTIQKGATIGPYTTIGSNSLIGSSSSISYSVLLENVFVGEECHLYEATVASNASIQQRSTLSTLVIGGDCLNKSANELMKSTENPLFINGRVIVNAQEGKSPQAVFRLCQALRMSMPNESVIIVGSDDDRCAHLFSNILMSGLQLQNFKVYTVGALPLPQLRYQVTKEAADYMIYVHREPHRAGSFLCLEIYNETGCLIDSMVEWKVEKQYTSMTNLDVKIENVSPILKLKSNQKDYIDYLIRSINVSSVIGANISIIVVGPSFIKEMVHHLCDELRITRYVACGNEINEEDISVLIKKYRASFAMIMDEKGEFFSLYDENGRVLTETNILALYIYSVSLTKKRSIIPVPVHYPSSLELLASRLHGKLVRVKSQKRALLNVLGPIHFQVDALYALCQIIELLSIQLHSISALIETVPKIHIEKEHIFCPWESQGLVMRKLLEEFSDQQIELIDGVKVYHQNRGWTLILPHGEMPALTIYSEATNELLAKELSTYVMRKIREYQEK